MDSTRTPFLRPALGLFFFLSGFSALVYQIAWQRVLTQVIGSDFVSVTLIVSIFMIGLGLGAHIAGAILPRLGKAAGITYTLIEVFVGAYGLVSTPLLRAVNGALATYNGGVFFDAAVNFLVLAPPIIGMGMTTPLVVHLATRTLGGLGRVVGLFYGINILGAAIGALVTGLVLIETFGLSGSTRVAAAINVGIGVLFFLLIRGGQAAQPTSERAHRSALTWTLAAFAFGFGTLALQMIFFRIATNYLTMSTVVFPTVLCAFLILMALGQAFGGALADRFPKHLNAVVVGLASAGALLLAAALWFPPPLAAAIDAFRFTTFNGALISAEHEGWIGDPKISSALIFSLMFMVAVAPWSALFPVLLRSATESVGQAGVRFASLYFVYTLGNLVGALIVGAYLLAVLGTTMSATITILVVAAGALLLWIPREKRFASSAFAVGGVALAVAAAVTLPHDYYRRFSFGDYQVSEVIEGRNGVATIVPTQRFYTIVDMNRTASASALAHDPAPADSYQAWRWNHTDLFALDPTFRPKRILMIGIGHGYLAESLLDLPFVEEITIVDLSDEVVEAVRRSTATDARRIFSDPRVHIVIDDGRRFVQAALARGEHYDLIQTKINEPWHGGSGNLFTVEFMTLQRRLLTPNGYLSVRPLAGHLVDGLAAFPVAMIAGDDGQFYHVYFRNGEMPPPTQALVTPDIAVAWSRELPGRDGPPSPRGATLRYAFFTADPFDGAIGHNTDDRPTFEYYWFRQLTNRWDDPRRSILSAAPTAAHDVPVVMVSEAPQ